MAHHWGEDEMWFDVDKEGLAKVLERRGKEFVLFELISNAWDAASSLVTVTLERVPASRHCRIVVEDNGGGFARLSDAFVLFAESTRKSDAARRGRYGLGEKLCLAVSDRAEIATVTGTVTFDEQGRHIAPRKRLAAGSRVTLVLKMTEEERKECEAAVVQLIPPHGCETRFNDKLLAARAAVASTEQALPTEIADAEGNLRRTVRRTSIEVYEPINGEEPHLYELGVRVVPSGLRWHVNIGQKVPQPLDRDNVSPAYHARVRAIVLELMHQQLSSEDANAAWVRDAIEAHGDDLTKEAVGAVLDLRFGEKRVSADPNDAEAMSLAMAQGYTVVRGSQMSGSEWAVAKQWGLIKPAGQVTPSPRPFSPDGQPLKLLARERLTAPVLAVVELIERIAPHLIGRAVHVSITPDLSWNFAAAYGAGVLTINFGRLGTKWFTGSMARIMDLVVHELAHEKSGNHLSSEYHDALTEIAGKAVALALDRPDLFERESAAVQ
jgi:hypothetical protein